jgi:hypothetical protein
MSYIVGDSPLDVRLDTKVWEGDYKAVLTPDYLIKLSSRTGIVAPNIRVILNNIMCTRSARKRAERARRDGLIGDYFFVDEIASEVLSFFDLDRASFGSGYRFSICELAAIYLNELPFTLHFSGDSLPLHAVSNKFYLQAKYALRQVNVRVVNLMWNQNQVEHQLQAEAEDSLFWYSTGGFSDQMYLVSTSEFRQNIYDFMHPLSNRYPSYAGNLFEKRVDSWMHCHNFLRATYKHGVYLHENRLQSRKTKLFRKVTSTR